MKPLVEFSRLATVALDIVAWGVISAGTGYLVHRLPARVFEKDLFVHRPRAIEEGGAFYVRVLRIKRWKRFLPEAGDLFAGGFNKRHVTAASDQHLAAHLRETRRAELGHWLAAATAPFFFLWNPWPVGIIMVAYATVANGPCIAAQRYNRLRLARILRRRTTPAPGSS